MGSVERELRTLFDDERRAVSAPGTVIESIAARISRRRAGRLAGASAGTVAAIGLAAAVPLALSHVGAPGLAPGSTPTATPTVIMPENPLGLGCGDPVPDSLATGENSEMEVYTVAVEVVTVQSSASETPTVIMTRGSNVQPTVGADYSRTIIARDGLVVGWTDAAKHAGTPATRMTTIEYSVWACPSARNDATGGFLDGTYVEYPIVDELATP